MLVPGAACSGAERLSAISCSPVSRAPLGSIGKCVAMSSDKSGRMTGDTGAGQLDDLYRSHFDWLVSRLRRTLGRHSDSAEDLAQETYLRVARYVSADAPNHPRALLAAIGANLSRDHARRQSRQSRLRETLHVIEAVEPEQDSDLLLQRSILALPDLYRDAFLLSRFTPLTNKQIADRLGVSTKTVEWRIARAIEICGKQLLDMEPEK